MREVKTKNSTYRFHGDEVMQVCGTSLSRLPAGKWVKGEATGVTVGCRMVIAIEGEPLITSPVTSIAEIDE